MKQILLVEDDSDYAKIVASILVDEGYSVDIETSSMNAIQATKKKKYDLLIADLEIDTLSGLHVAEIVRRDTPLLPMMILTGSVRDEDEIKALDTGLNDYVKKSVSFNVLVGRVNHIFDMQKQPEVVEEFLTSTQEDITVDIENRTVLKAGEEIYLTVLEYDLLVYFLKKRNKIITRDDIIADVWKTGGENAAIDLRVVDTFVKNIRKKLHIQSIYSIRGIGYRWHE